LFQEPLKSIKNGLREIVKTTLRIGDLVRDVLRNPFEGIGKPEALKHQFKGYWSRRINHEHRLIYKVSDTSIIIISCYSHAAEQFALRGISMRT
jgi:toxin YoeB